MGPSTPPSPGEPRTVHRMYVHEGIPHTGERLIITGEEAEHAARVKRIAPGDRVQLLDGHGTVAAALVGRAGPERSGRGRVWILEVTVESVCRAQPPHPAVEVWAATPKGSRVDELVEGLSQVGAAAWSPLAAERTVVTPRETKLERLERIAWESAKQCGRAWVLRIGRERTLAEGLASEPGVRVVVADASGAPYDASGAAAVRILVGPEGGWSQSELEAARSSGATIARFGPHAMRIETAAVVAAAIVLDAESRVRR